MPLNLKRRLGREEGWTFIEATLSVVLISIMILGLTIVLLAFREHLDRSWGLRVMDQYGNDVVERLTHELRNATDVTVRHQINNPSRKIDRIDVKFLDPYVHNLYHTNYWRADLRNARILVNNNNEIDPTFPPRQPGRGEYYVIQNFSLTPFGGETPNRPNELEREESFRRKPEFVESTYDITFTIRYNRSALRAGEHNWFVEREYRNKVYLRNKNLIVKKGITD